MISSELWHSLEADRVIERLATDRDEGLEELELLRRQEKFGPNALTPRVAESSFHRLLRQFQQPLVYVLLAAMVVTIVLHEWADATVIAIVVLVNALIGYFQESNAVKAIASLTRAMQSEATVVRNGETHQIASKELVPGDLVLLQSGDRVPADLRLIRVRDLQIDESALTGESVAAEKSIEVCESKAMVNDRTNIAYSTTLVSYGTGAGIVVATGDTTEIGRINEMIASADELETPLTQKINHFSHTLLIVILFLALSVAAAILIRGEPPSAVFLAAVALAVGAIPEGLPAVVTATLALGVSRLAARRAVIRKLPAVETLGSTTVICSDKTGTLTQNQMTVRRILVPDQSFEVSGSGYDPTGDIKSDDTSIESEASIPLREILLAGLLCNDSRLRKENDQWCHEGDPTEVALLTSAEKYGLDRSAEESRAPRIDTIPFESQYQYMATLHQSESSHVVYLKGAVEKVLERCEVDFSGSPIDRSQVEADVTRLASQGLRVLAFARKEVATDQKQIDHQDVNSGLSFLGLQAMIDPPRPEAIQAVKVCQSAGIQVKMITGDHLETATAIANQLEISGKRESNGRLSGISGRDLEGLSDIELIEAAETISVFARVSPAQKLRLVESLQSQQNVVAMTGDGVNDAPALRQADIGVAMGITGTEVAKEAADMILTDDNFATIEAAVEEGRGIYDNLIKFIIWTLPTNLAEAGVIIVSAFMGFELPITPLQILWINTTTAVLLGATLAFEPKEPEIMSRHPRVKNAPVIEKQFLMRTLWVALILIIAAYSVFEFKKSLGVETTAARTAAVNVIVFGELFYLFACRSLTLSMFHVGLLTNRWLWGGVLITTILQLSLTYVPLLNSAFETAPMSWRAWGLVLIAAMIVYLYAETDKGIRRVLEKKHDR